MCVVGFRTLVVSEADDSQLNHAVGEWMSNVFTSSTIDSFTACFIFDVKFGKVAKRMNAEVIYEDLNDTIHNVSLLNYSVRTRDAVDLKDERYGTFEFHLNSTTKYQVCLFRCSIYSVYFYLCIINQNIK